MNNLYDNFNENIKEFDEQQLLKSINMLADLVEDGLKYRKNNNENKALGTATMKAYRLCRTFIKDKGLEEEYRQYVNAFPLDEKDRLFVETLNENIKEY